MGLRIAVGSADLYGEGEQWGTLRFLTNGSTKETTVTVEGKRTTDQDFQVVAQFTIVEGKLGVLGFRRGHVAADGTVVEDTNRGSAEGGSSNAGPQEDVAAHTDERVEGSEGNDPRIRTSKVGKDVQH